MNHSLSRVVVLTVVGFLLFLTQTRAFGEELSLQLFLLQEAGPTNFINIKMGEPVRLLIQLTNQGKHAVRVISRLHPATGSTALVLINPDGSHKYLAIGRWEKMDMYAPDMDLAPNKTLFFETFLYGNMAQREKGIYKYFYLFPEQGNYGLYATFINPPPNHLALTSGVVRIAVGSPIPKWEELQEAGIVDAIEGRSSSDKEAIARQEQLWQILPISDHPLLPWIMPAEWTLSAQMRLDPEALAVSPGILTAFVRLPEGYPVSGITSATCDGARPERMMPNEDGTEMTMKFRRKDIEEALAQRGEILNTQFVVRGVWQGAGRTSLFQGTASIKKIVGPKK